MQIKYAFKTSIAGRNKILLALKEENSGSLVLFIKPELFQPAVFRKI